MVITADFFAEKRVFCGADHRQPRRGATRAPGPWIHRGPAWSIVEGEHAGRHHDRGRPGRSSPRPAWLTASTWRACSSRRARAKHPVNQPRYLLAVREQGPRKPAAEPAAGPRPEGPATAVAVEPPPLPKTCGILSGLVHTVPATRPPEIFPPPRGGASSTRARAASPRAVGLVIVEGEHAGRHHDRGRGPEGIRRFCHRNRLVDRPPRPAWSTVSTWSSSAPRARRSAPVPLRPSRACSSRRARAASPWAVGLVIVEGEHAGRHRDRGRGPEGIRRFCHRNRLVDRPPRPAWSTVSTWSSSAPIVEGEHAGRHHRPADPHRRVAGLVDHRRGRGSEPVDRRRQSGPRRRVSTPVVTTGPQIRTVALLAWSIDRRGRPGRRSRRGADRRRSSRVSTPVVTTGPQIRTATAVEVNRSIVAGSPDLDEG